MQIEKIREISDFWKISTFIQCNLSEFIPRPHFLKNFDKVVAFFVVLIFYSALTVESILFKKYPSFQLWNSWRKAMETMKLPNMCLARDIWKYKSIDLIAAKNLQKQLSERYSNANIYFHCSYGKPNENVTK